MRPIGNGHIFGGLSEDIMFTLYATVLCILITNDLVRHWQYPADFMSLSQYVASFFFFFIYIFILKPRFFV